MTADEAKLVIGGLYLRVELTLPENLDDAVSWPRRFRALRSLQDGPRRWPGEIQVMTTPGKCSTISKLAFVVQCQSHSIWKLRRRERVTHIHAHFGFKVDEEHRFDVGAIENLKKEKGIDRARGDADTGYPKWVMTKWLTS